jgi:Calcineurin-like phosphoesterase
MRVAHQSIDRFLKTTPITQHAAIAQQTHRFGKNARPPGNPVSSPKGTPRFAPLPTTNLDNLNLGLSVVLPEETATAESKGVLVFDAVGDTGGVYGDDAQKAVADAMEAQRVASARRKHPSAAFLYNLGDLVYFNGLSNLYISQFYEPYQNYHAAIFAIAGNHDGDNQTLAGHPVGNEPSLFGFMRNFCDTISQPASAYRPTMTQPYVYWTLEAPFTRIIGLYSNVDGSLDARGTNEQQRWLTNQMAASSKDECLILAVHHPPYSLDIVHGGYPEIEVAIDSAIHATGRVPTAVLSGHVHSYQRFVRTIGNTRVPYVVAGAGGFANTVKLLYKIEKGANGKRLPRGFQTTHPDLTLAAFNDTDPGYLRVSVDGKKRTLTLQYFVVPFSGTPRARASDSVVAHW